MMFRVGEKVRVAAAICMVAFVVRGAEKKIIGHSWDLLGMRPADVVRNLDAWEQMPLDGISLMLNKQLPDGGRKISEWGVMNEPPWERQWFIEDLATIRQCGSRNLKHNFLLTYWGAFERLAWNDDEAWNNFAHNMGIVAWIAKEGQTKGIMIDREDYHSMRQYSWEACDAPYAQTVVLARQRGAQIMTSMAKEYPDITLLSFWLLSMCDRALVADDPLAVSIANGDLWPAFVNGMLDVLPPGARIIEGNENGYTYKAATKDFYQEFWRVKSKALELVDPVNRTKYQTQVLAGFGLYLDMYTNPSDSYWFFGELNGSRLNHLHSNLAQALDVAQEYVWLYGEKMDWIKWTGTDREKNPTWEERLPGFSSTLKRLRDPRRWAEQMVEQQRQTETLTNCIVNGACVLEKTENQEAFLQGVLPAGWEVLPAGWGSWQDEKKCLGVSGTETRKGRGDNFSLCAVGMERGRFATSYRTLPGKEFVVDAYAQGVAPRLKVYWKRAGEWDRSLTLEGAEFNFAAAGSDGWQRAIGLVRVPEGADELVVILATRQGEGERTWFDDVGLYPLKDQ